MAVGQVTPQRLQAAFRVDASPRMGGGHMMRCLTLARRLVASRVDVAFIVASIDHPLRALVQGGGVRLIEIERSASIGCGAQRWDEASWPGDVQQNDAARSASQLQGLRLDWLFVDHYGLDRHWEQAMRPHARRLAVIDDLANRPHDCDLLLDQTYARDKEDYAPLVGPGTELLIGAEYALLRSEFADARPAGLARHLTAGSVDRIIISLGMTDVGALTEIAARAALEATNAHVDIVIGSAAPTLGALRAFTDRHARVALHVDTQQVCDLMIQADMAIGAAGSTSWERCCLGLPAVTFAIAGNQRFIATKLAGAGAIHLIDASNVGAIARAVCELSSDPVWRARMAEASARICDGEGAARVASRVLD